MVRGTRALTILVVAALATACTVKETKAPAVSGPSELSLSLAVSANPDLLTLNGSSQSLILVQALDSSAQPVRGLGVRFDVMQGGQVVDYGTLSAKSAVTGSDGRASVVYTAPSASLLATDSGANTITVQATPVSNNYANAFGRTVEIRLVPPGVIVPPSDLVAGFTFSPSTPQVLTSVVFTAPTCATSSSTDCSAGSISSYVWDFGDGGKGGGQVATHAFGAMGSYGVTLTVYDALGRAASTTKVVPVAAGTAPSASFTISPTTPLAADTIFFNAAGSTATPPRYIADYSWNFGDGVTARGVNVSHVYGKIGSFTVTLVVTDDSGRSTATTQVVTTK